MPMDIVLKTLIAEAADQDDEGMYAVASTFVNRAARRKQTLEQVVNAPAQYTGRWRKHLDQFVAQQGPEVAARAQRALERAKAKPLPGLDHYTTTELMQRKPPSWSRNMGGRRTIGGHLFMDSQQPLKPRSATPRTTDERIAQLNQRAVRFGLAPLKAPEIERMLSAFEPPGGVTGTPPTPLDEDRNERQVIAATAQQLRGSPRQARASSALMGQG